MRKKIKEHVLDRYFQFAICVDVLLAVSLIMLNKYIPVVKFVVLKRDEQLDFISNLIGTTVSLAGFVLAALTIIVSFKASLKGKKFQDADNALEYLFTTKHYKNIVKTFRKSIAELVLVFILLYCSWLSSANINDADLANITVSAVFVTVAAIVRSLFVLFRIFTLEFTERS